MEQFTIHIVKPEEYKILAVLGRETFYETWREYNTEQDMQIYLKQAFDEEKILKDLRNEKVNTFLFARAGGNHIGYAKLRNDRSHVEFNGSVTLELERIYVRKSLHGTNAGKLLMDKCLEIASAAKYDWLWLGVNIDNARAIAFYKKYGFEIFGTKTFQLGDAEDQDYLMKLKL